MAQIATLPLWGPNEATGQMMVGMQIAQDNTRLGIAQDALELNRQATTAENTRRDQEEARAAELYRRGIQRDDEQQAAGKRMGEILPSILTGKPQQQTPPGYMMVPGQGLVPLPSPKATRLVETEDPANDPLIQEALANLMKLSPQDRQAVSPLLMARIAERTNTNNLLRVRESMERMAAAGEFQGGMVGVDGAPVATPDPELEARLQELDTLMEQGAIDDQAASLELAAIQREASRRRMNAKNIGGALQMFQQRMAQSQLDNPEADYSYATEIEDTLRATNVHAPQEEIDKTMSWFRAESGQASRGNRPVKQKDGTTAYMDSRQVKSYQENQRAQDEERTALLNELTRAQIREADANALARGTPRGSLPSELFNQQLKLYVEAGEELTPELENRAWAQVFRQIQVDNLATGKAKPTATPPAQDPKAPGGPTKFADLPPEKQAEIRSGYNQRAATDPAGAVAWAKSQGVDITGSTNEDGQIGDAQSTAAPRSVDEALDTISQNEGEAARQANEILRNPDDYTAEELKQARDQFDTAREKQRAAAKVRKLREELTREFKHDPFESRDAWLLALNKLKAEGPAMVEGKLGFKFPDAQADANLRMKIQALEQVGAAAGWQYDAGEAAAAAKRLREKKK